MCLCVCLFSTEPRAPSQPTGTHRMASPRSKSLCKLVCLLFALVASKGAGGVCTSVHVCGGGGDREGLLGQHASHFRMPPTHIHLTTHPHPSIHHLSIGPCLRAAGCRAADLPAMDWQTPRGATFDVTTCDNLPFGQDCIATCNQGLPGQTGAPRVTCTYQGWQNLTVGSCARKSFRALGNCHLVTNTVTLISDWGPNGCVLRSGSVGREVSDAVRC